MRRFQLGFAVFLAPLALAQSLPVRPAFDAADIRPSPHAGNVAMRGGYYSTGIYELHQATMADLVRTAWGLDDNSRVIGGPSWLDDDRFDVLAKAPAATSRETAQMMLRNLLEDRAGLVAHDDKAPMTAYALVTDPRTRLLMKAADGTGQERTGACQEQPWTAEISPVPLRIRSCRGITMTEFVKALPDFAGDYFGHIPVVEMTKLDGAWDFGLRWNPRAQLQAAGGDGLPIFDAVRKQLGLQLEQRQVPLPIVVVDRVNEHPIAAPAETARMLPAAPTQFEVAVIKLSTQNTPSGKVLPGGEIDFRGNTLKDLVRYAWSFGGFGEDDMVQGPKWMATERFDVLAKVPSDGSPSAVPPDDSTLRVMMRNLLTSRFGMVFHYEQRPVEAYSLVASKPKLTPADPSRRTGCKFVAMPPGARTALTRNFACQNITVSRFSEKLADIATEYIDHPVVDSTGLKGAWDFTLSFSPRRQRQANSIPAVDIATEPDGSLTLFDALETELGIKVESKKLPMSVLVIDQVEHEPLN